MTSQLEKLLIDGKYAKAGNVVGRCNSSVHPGFLTKQLIKSHDCIARTCSFFVRMNPEYWVALEKAEQKKKETRLQKRQLSESIKTRDALIRETLENKGHIYVTAIREEGPRLLTVSYIYDERIDLTDEIQFLRDELKKAIRLEARIASDETKELLIRKLCEAERNG